MTLTNKNYNHEKFMSRLNSENISGISALICLVMEAAQQQAKHSCFSFGTCIVHQFFCISGRRGCCHHGYVADDVTVGRCVAVLNVIFGKVAVPKPNSWACVSFCFFLLDPESVALTTASDQGVLCRLCFAGEHTIRNIATEFLGSAHGSPEQLIVGSDRVPLSGTIP
jgi:hypothetical protein